MAAVQLALRLRGVPGAASSETESCVRAAGNLAEHKLLCPPLGGAFSLPGPFAKQTSSKRQPGAKAVRGCACEMCTRVTGPWETAAQRRLTSWGHRARPRWALALWTWCGREYFLIG